MSKRPISGARAPPRAPAARRRAAARGVVLGRAVGHVVVGRVRDAQREPVALRLRRGELVLASPAAPPSRASAPRAAPASACPSSFWRQRSSSTCGTSARQRSSAASSASNASAAPLRASAARNASGSARAARRSITRVSLGTASSTWATPSSSAAGQTAVGDRRARGRARSRPRRRSPPTRAARRRSRRRRTRPCARGEAEPLGEERRARALGHARARELEEVRQRLRDVEPVAEARLRAAPRTRRARPGRRRRRASSAARSSQREQVADGVDRDVLEVRVRPRLGRDLGDVELVVDVHVQARRPRPSTAATASRASSSGIGSWRRNSPSASATTAPW